MEGRGPDVSRAEQRRVVALRTLRCLTEDVLRLKQGMVSSSDDELHYLAMLAEDLAQSTMFERLYRATFP